ncbi:UPF0481 protein At3g47200-like isoform X3 [Spinacia oleracea]|uniref:UPF0481 protein At3g47200-like isoform X3 n=1 Tax=Spinacia oleracea TaxID=3562 RepID=A0A9R0K5A0_SPIOL|nr:UPF0481 protein At3g47200-like isoform X3 [Spinacia oleracea]
MLRNKSVSLHFEYLSRSSFTYARQLCSKALLAEEHYVAGSSTNSSGCLEEKMKAMQQEQQQQQLSLHSSRSSIYHVPAKLRKIDPKAYEPHFISIGPYHHGSPNLQDSEKFKLQSLNRLVGLGKQKLAADINAIELEARECYSDDVKLSREEFVYMMLLDGCFIVDLFKELNQKNFVCSNSSLLSKRWMLPVVRRDLITLENQLPMIVLKKIFDATRTNSTEEGSLEELALRFFDPLMPREEDVLQQSITSVNGNHQKFQHLLDIFHSSITLGNKVKRSKEPHMYRSVAELKEAGIKVRVLGNTQPLELRFEREVLRMPSLLIDNHTASVFRNIVAYEQCHRECKPDMTTYLFFLDKLINSAEDVGLLHYEGVIQHTLGSNKQVAKLVNNLCVEVEHDGQESYLCEVVERLNFYSDRWFSKASCDAIEAQEKEQRLKNKEGAWVRVNSLLVHPVEGLKQMVGSGLRFIARGGIEPEDPPPWICGRGTA